MGAVKSRGTCRELKRYLSGKSAVFDCELIHLGKDVGILRYILDRPAHVGPVTLQPGDVTYAFYWLHRPYNLFWWRRTDGSTIAHYFNLADRTELSAEQFSWRDLVVDILVTPDGGVHVLDEEELPGGIEDALRLYIRKAKGQVMRKHASVAAEAALLLAARSEC